MKRKSRITCRLATIAMSLGVLSAQLTLTTFAYAGLDCTGQNPSTCGLPHIPPPPRATCPVGAFGLESTPSAGTPDNNSPAIANFDVSWEKTQERLKNELKAEWAGDAAAKAQTATTSFPCYVAFIHGAGVNDSAFHGPKFSTGWGVDSKPGVTGSPLSHCGSTDSQERYWMPANNSIQDSFTFRAGRQHKAPEERCMVWRVAYNAVDLTYAEQSLQIATELVNFINRYRIPSHKLTIVAHSLGGVASRFILNNAVPTSPYYWGFFGTVAAATKALVTVQSPHTGTQAAELLWYETSDRALPYVADSNGEPVRNENWVEGIGWWDSPAFNTLMRSKTRAWESARRTYIERAAASGGWMSDGARSTVIYTIAGTGFDPNNNGNGSNDDHSMSMLNEVMCFKPGSINNQGSYCSTGENMSSDAASDGFVEQLSGLGTWTRDNPALNVFGFTSSLQGHNVPWAVVDHNHNQGRWDLISRGIHIVSATRGGISGNTNDFLASFLGDNMMSLPE
jgi:hypothetical protein